MHLCVRSWKVQGRGAVRRVVSPTPCNPHIPGVVGKMETYIPTLFTPSTARFDLPVCLDTLSIPSFCPPHNPHSFPHRPPPLSISPPDVRPFSTPRHSGTWSTHSVTVVRGWVCVPPFYLLLTPRSIFPSNFGLKSIQTFR